MTVKRRFCAVCNCELTAERIDALPETRLCDTHARAIKKYGGEFLSRTSRTSLGKTDSLKKNYGDVTVRRRRNLEGLQRLQEDHEREQWDKKRQGG